MMPYWHIKLGKYEITKLPLASTDLSWISRKRKVKVLAISFSLLQGSEQKSQKQKLHSSMWNFD